MVAHSPPEPLLGLFTQAEAQRVAQMLQQAFGRFAALGQQFAGWIAADRERALRRLPPGTDPARLRARFGIVWELEPAHIDGGASASVRCLSKLELQERYGGYVSAFPDPGPVPSRKEDEAFWRARGVSRDRWRELRRDCPDPRLHKNGPKN